MLMCILLRYRPVPSLPAVREALMPRSCGQPTSYEKLEIVGDAVLKYEACTASGRTLRPMRVKPNPSAKFQDLQSKLPHSLILTDASLAAKCDLAGK